MGVPAFFRWLSRKYASIVVHCVEEKPKEVDGVKIPVDSSQPNPNDVEFDNLYLDMNGIIHPCCHPEDRPAPKNENEMMVLIFEYIDRIFSIVRPRRLLYMAIDGVAPRAKMNQQRSRRFRAAKESIEKFRDMARIKAELRAKGANVPEDKPDQEHFDSNCITPGTPFMFRLAECLRFYIHDRLNNDPGWNGIKVILSDANVPGEGEHKIMDYIRRQRAQPDHDPNTHHCLCGADADLIMLGLATHEPHFTIIREEFKPNKPRPCDICGQLGHEMKECTGAPKEKSGEFDEIGESICEEQQFIFLRLNILREYLEKELRMDNLPFEYEFERAIDDWVFMCFFVGNDFLPHLPSLEIREGAIDRLVRLYKKAVYKTGGYLTKHGHVYLERVQLVLSDLGEVEDEIFKNRRETELGFRRRDKEKKKRLKQVTNSNPPSLLDLKCAPSLMSLECGPPPWDPAPGNDGLLPTPMNYFHDDGLLPTPMGFFHEDSGPSDSISGGSMDAHGLLPTPFHSATESSGLLHTPTNNTSEMQGLLPIPQSSLLPNPDHLSQTSGPTSLTSSLMPTPLLQMSLLPNRFGLEQPMPTSILGTPVKTEGTKSLLLLPWERPAPSPAFPIHSHVQTKHENLPLLPHPLLSGDPSITPEIGLDMNFANKPPLLPSPAGESKPSLNTEQIQPLLPRNTELRKVESREYLEKSESSMAIKNLAEAEDVRKLRNTGCVDYSEEEQTSESLKTVFPAKCNPTKPGSAIPSLLSVKCVPSLLTLPCQPSSSTPDDNDSRDQTSEYTQTLNPPNTGSAQYLQSSEHSHIERTSGLIRNPPPLNQHIHKYQDDCTLNNIQQSVSLITGRNADSPSVIQPLLSPDSTCKVSIDSETYKYNHQYDNTEHMGPETSEINQTLGANRIEYVDPVSAESTSLKTASSLFTSPENIEIVDTQMDHKSLDPECTPSAAESIPSILEVKCSKPLMSLQFGQANAPKFMLGGQYAPKALGAGRGGGVTQNPRQTVAEMRTQSMHSSNSDAAAALRSMLSNGEEQRGDKRKHEDSESEEEPEDDVKLWEAGWKDRYYKGKFSVGPDDIEFRHTVAQEYVIGLCWVLAYYYQGCPSWKWYFPFHYAPFASDFINIGDVDTSFEKNTEPFNPLEQLMGVFPAASKQHLPITWQDLMDNPDSNIIDFYPSDFGIDLNGKKFAWQGVALLPFVDEKRLLKELTVVYPDLTSQERFRNCRGCDRLFVGREHPSHDYLEGLYETGDKSTFVDLNTDLAEGMKGTVACDEFAVLSMQTVQSPLPAVKDVPNNMAISVKFKDPQFDQDFVFPAVVLKGAKFPDRVLKPEDFEAMERAASRGGFRGGRGGWRGRGGRGGFGGDRGGYRPQLGFKPESGYRDRNTYNPQVANRLVRGSMGGGQGSYGQVPPAPSLMQGGGGYGGRNYNQGNRNQGGYGGGHERSSSYGGGGYGGGGGGGGGYNAWQRNTSGGNNAYQQNQQRGYQQQQQQYRGGNRQQQYGSQSSGYGMLNEMPYNRDSRDRRSYPPPSNRRY